jgi:adenine deaminase
MSIFSVSGNIVDIQNQEIYLGTVTVTNGRISSITRDEGKTYSNYIMPGFIDSHIHIESSMLIPSSFARMAVVHGTVATVSDPHEIANVLGIDGVNYMIDDGEKVPFKFYFGAPSCVPATPFETSGAVLSSDDIRKLFENPKIKYLSEMMNFPGVINDMPEVIDKIRIAKESGRPIDGHAPGLMGDDLYKYISYGISTDHESLTLEEAIDKLHKGMMILIRDGSATSSFDILHKLVETRPDMCMFCSDDKHPDDLIEGHINSSVKKSFGLGYNLWKILEVATVNPIRHYKLDVGMLRAEDNADFIVVDRLDKDMKVLQTYINGQLVADNGKTLIDEISYSLVNKFEAKPTKPADFLVTPKTNNIRVIEAINNQLITNKLTAPAKIVSGNVVSDVEKDILKIAVINRYKPSRPALAFIKNLGIKKGALASSIAHDSHNIIVVGTDDEAMSIATNELIKHKGGIVCYDGEQIASLPLPVAGLMTGEDGWKVADKYSVLDKMAKDMGSKLKAPFMTLSFMALLVIPSIKLSDEGLFDGNTFEFIDLFVD